MSQEDWNRVRDIALRAFWDAIDAVGSIEVVERGNRQTVNDAVNFADAGMAMHLVKAALMERVLFLTMRAYDKPRNGDRNMRVAFDLLQSPTVRSLAGPRRNVHLDEACRLWALARANPRLDELRHHRNKFVAHQSAPIPTMPEAKIAALYECAHEMAEVAGQLALGAGVVNQSVDEGVVDYRESADAFWSRWA